MMKMIDTVIEQLDREVELEGVKVWRSISGTFSLRTTSGTRPSTADNFRYTFG
jgi:hypothetical protein